MDKKIIYSVLRYSPSAVSGESINLGIIILEKEVDYREFYYTKKLSRVMNFDDTMRKDVVIKLLESIKADVEKNIFNYGGFDVEEYTKYYKNNYYFEKPKALLYESLDKQILELKKTFFRFDFDKAVRPTANDDLQMLDRIIRSEYDDVRKKPTLTGPAEENIQFDFSIGKLKIKMLDLDNKELSRMINTVKAWVWNCQNDNDIVVIYRDASEEQRKSREYKSIMNIMQKNDVNIFSFDDGIEYIRNKAV